MIHNSCVRCKFYDDFKQSCFKGEKFYLKDDPVYGQTYVKEFKYPSTLSIYEIREYHCKGEDFEPKLSVKLLSLLTGLFKKKS